MDLMDFDKAGLYFDEPVAAGVQDLIAEAGGVYGQAAAEALLHKAYFLAPESLVVLVALYRYYFYQHRLEDALLVGERALGIVGRRLGFPDEWSRLHPDFLGQAVLRSMGLLRFYMSVLKATGYINLRLGRMAQGQALIEKLVELDSHDRFGGRAMLEMIVAAVADRIEEAA
ncbi:hypothetical protein EZJ19_14930 [Parasulfuritortus cantonensis]|uniref:Tetratricopeptide repeat protein n=1 Tax=Parasulfuritortus cantonensis TaxID=2528202 RepID=A0A4V2NV17_9PROT|nr:hypothetical protein [Parasulfuritortus cantonensis]TCJ11706.1 hypothetical protein EZJ19_14930 [Parasulfuritortus cantonensis]